MPVTASDYLENCKSTLESSTDEVHYRNIISRAYYSMYHGTLEILSSTPPSYSGVGTHSSLITYLQSTTIKSVEKHDHRSLKALSYILEQYKAKRCLADYELSATIQKADAIDSIEAAKRFYNKCKDLHE